MLVEKMRAAAIFSYERISLSPFRRNNSYGLWCWCMTGQNVNFHLVWRPLAEWERQRGYFVCNSSWCQDAVYTQSPFAQMFACCWYSASVWTHVRSPLQFWQSNENCQTNTPWPLRSPERVHYAIINHQQKKEKKKKQKRVIISPL